MKCYVLITFVTLLFKTNIIIKPLEIISTHYFRWFGDLKSCFQGLERLIHDVMVLRQP